MKSRLLNLLCPGSGWSTHFFGGKDRGRVIGRFQIVERRAGKEKEITQRCRERRLSSERLKKEPKSLAQTGMFGKKGFGPDLAKGGIVALEHSR